ncbi:MAG: hypothetical protein KY433_01925 [Actinobacteria bacterium]|nr:hypothetical protein [Actinomycetota bacterium]
MLLGLSIAVIPNVPLLMLARGCRGCSPRRAAAGEDLEALRPQRGAI